MAKGFKKDGKFRPTDNSSGNSSREKSVDVIEGMTLSEQREAEILMSDKVREAFMEGEEFAQEQKFGKGTVALNITDPLAETKTARRKQAMVLKLDDEDSIVTKPEIEWMRKFLNDSFGNTGDVDQDFVDSIKDKVDNNPDGFRITPEQTTQGLDFLRKTKNQKVFSEREKDILENFKEFRLIGWQDASSGSTFFVPLWKVESTDGNSFEYYFAGGEVEITG